MSDAWGEESQVNQMGTYIAVIPAILAALLLWGVIPVELPAGLLFIIVAVCGIVGGAVNVLGRGPLAAGAIVGLLTAVGGFGMVYWWLQGRESVRTFEIAIAFIIGALPGFLLQYFLPRILGRQEAAD